MTHPFAQRIQDVYPEMSIVDVQTEHAAQHYIVFTVNYRLVFRFARNQYGTKALQWEAKHLLPAVAGIAKLPVPLPELSSFDRLEPGFAFMGYERIEGEQLWPETLESLIGTDVLEQAAGSVADFLYNLHKMDLPDYRSFEHLDSETPTDLRMLSVKVLYERTVGELFTHMSPQAQKRVENDFGTFANEESRGGWKSWIHGSFGPAHILWDAQEEAISGVIGFGSARIGDPAFDLADLLTAYGPAFFEKCLESYPGGETLIERAKFYASVLPLREALHGLEEGDDESLAYGLTAYEQETSFLYDREVTAKRLNIFGFEKE